MIFCSTNFRFKFVSCQSLGVILSLWVILGLIGCGGSEESSQNEGQSTKEYSVSGFVQKGPFSIGSNITIQELGSDLSPTGRQFSTATTDNLGSFISTATLASPLVEIIANGFFYEEIAGTLSPAPLTLRTISDLSGGQPVNINLLTHLEKTRLFTLFAAGNTFDQARTQAKTEVLAIFNISQSAVSDFDQMDITIPGDSNAILLAVSSVIQQMATNRAASPSNSVAELSFVLSTIVNDLGPDGTFDNSPLISEILLAGMTLNLQQVRDNLVNYYNGLGLTVTPPTFESFVDTDGDGVLNKDDDDDDGDGLLDNVDPSPRDHRVNWRTGAPIPTTRINAGIGVVNGKIYIIGGVDGNGVSVSVDEYDPLFNVWDKKNDMPNQRIRAASCTLNNKIYIIGDADNVKADLVEVYDPSNDSWGIAANLNVPRESLSCSVASGKLYAIGGQHNTACGQGQLCATVEEYDPDLNLWMLKAEMPTPRNSLTTASINNKIYAMGGNVSGGSIKNEEFDPVQNIWSTKESLPILRGNHSASSFGGNIYLFGGASGLSSIPGFYNQVDIYDPTTDSWRIGTPMPTPRTQLMSAEVNGRVFVMGGNDSVLLDTVEIYDPEIDQ